jgi:hypothetical protein
LFEWDDLSEEALQNADIHLRQRWGACKDRLKEMVTSSHLGKRNGAWATNPSPPYHQIGSHAEESDKRKQRRKNEKKAGTTTRQDMGSGEDFIIYEDKGGTDRHRGGGQQQRKQQSRGQNCG